MELDDRKRDDLSEKLVEARIDLRKKESRLAELSKQKKEFEDKCSAFEKKLGESIESASSQTGVMDFQKRQAGQSDAKELASWKARAQKAAEAIATVEKEIEALKKTASDALDKLVAAYL
jgi:chromosome segregation ATPase